MQRVRVCALVLEGAPRQHVILAATRAAWKAVGIKLPSILTFGREPTKILISQKL
jgi:hypothetical protein